jgi:hypothetical protein
MDDGMGAERHEFVSVFNRVDEIDRGAPRDRMLPAFDWRRRP